MCFRLIVFADAVLQFIQWHLSFVHHWSLLTETDTLRLITYLTPGDDKGFPPLGLGWSLSGLKGCACEVKWQQNGIKKTTCFALCGWVRKPSVFSPLMFRRLKDMKYISFAHFRNPTSSPASGCHRSPPWLLLNLIVSEQGGTVPP